MSNNENTLIRGSSPPARTRLLFCRTDLFFFLLQLGLKFFSVGHQLLAKRLFFLKIIGGFGDFAVQGDFALGDLCSVF
jgi:hypothetical protein